MTMMWQPSQERIENSQMYAFMRAVGKDNYAALYQWSIDFPEEFWKKCWQFCEIKASRLSERIIEPADEMWKTRFFPQAKLNFAENLLSRRDEKIALIAINEKGERRSFTYKALYHAVINLALELKDMGITAGDRVVGYMPNIPETIIAMLATTALGAIWSCCSPDFGVTAVLDRFAQIQPKILFAVKNYYYNGKLFETADKIKLIEDELDSLQKTIYLTESINTEEISPERLSSEKLFSEKLSPEKISPQKLFSEKLSPENFSEENLSSISSFVFEQFDFNHPLYILYSSGTTGVPKCIVHGAGGTLLQHLKELKLHTDITEKDVFFYYTTCGWMMWNWYVSGLALGATLIQFDGSPVYPTHTRLLDLIDEENISVFGTSAKFLSAFEKAKLIPRKTHQLNSLKTILSTGSPLLPPQYDYVYQSIKPDVCLSSISGGTDIISCFALGNPILPVYRGELQCRGLGLKVDVFNSEEKSVIQEKGELVCTAPFPCMPIYFWNDKDDKKYRQAYFEKFPNIWTHGDYAEMTEHNGMIIYGRSDAVLNPCGIRIGTAEIYREVEKHPDILESIAVEQQIGKNTRVLLFIKLKPDAVFSEAFVKQIKENIKLNLSPHHVPAKIIPVPDIPKTINGKILELAVKEIVHGREVKNKSVIINPECLTFFAPPFNADNNIQNK